MASFDGLAPTAELPFDLTTATESAITRAFKEAVASQRVEWDTSNIVSGTSLTPENVRGGLGQFLSRQIPWGGADIGTLFPLIAPLIPTTLDVANLTGGIIDASHLPPQTDIYASNIYASNLYVTSNIVVDRTISASNVECDFISGVLTTKLDFAKAFTTPRTDLVDYDNKSPDPYARMSQVIDDVSKAIFNIDRATNMSIASNLYVNSNVYTSNIYAQTIESRYTIQGATLKGNLDYSYLTNIPTSSQSDWTVGDTTNLAFIKNKPIDLSQFENRGLNALGGYNPQFVFARMFNLYEIFEDDITFTSNVYINEGLTVQADAFFQRDTYTLGTSFASNLDTQFLDVSELVTAKNIAVSNDVIAGGRFRGKIASSDVLGTTASGFWGKTKIDDSKNYMEFHQQITGVNILDVLYTKASDPNTSWGFGIGSVMSDSNINLSNVIPDRAFNFNLLSDVGVHSSNIYGNLHYSQMPSFLSPTISYEAKERELYVDYIYKDVPIIGISDIVDRIHLQWDGMTDEQIWRSFDQTPGSIPDFTRIYDARGSSNNSYITTSSNLRYSIGGFKDVTSDNLISTKLITGNALTVNGLAVFNNQTAVNNTLYVRDSITCLGNIQAGGVSLTGGEITLRKTYEVANNANATADEAWRRATAALVIAIVGGGVGAAAAAAVVLLKSGWAVNLDANVNRATTLQDLVDQGLNEAIDERIEKWMGNPDNAGTVLKSILESMKVQPWYEGADRLFMINRGRAAANMTTFVKIMNATAQMGNLEFVQNTKVREDISRLIDEKIATANGLDPKWEDNGLGPEAVQIEAAQADTAGSSSAAPVNPGMRMRFSAAAIARKGINVVLGG